MGSLDVFSDVDDPDIFSDVDDLGIVAVNMESQDVSSDVDDPDIFSDVDDPNILSDFEDDNHSAESDSDYGGSSLSDYDKLSLSNLAENVKQNLPQVKSDNIQKNLRRVRALEITLKSDDRSCQRWLRNVQHVTFERLVQDCRLTKFCDLDAKDRKGCKILEPSQIDLSSVKIVMVIAKAFGQGEFIVHDWTNFERYFPNIEELTYEVDDGYGQQFDLRGIGKATTLRKLTLGLGPCHICEGQHGLDVLAPLIDLEEFKVGCFRHASVKDLKVVEHFTKLRVLHFEGAVDVDESEELPRSSKVDLTKHHALRELRFLPDGNGMCFHSATEKLLPIGLLGDDYGIRLVLPDRLESIVPEEESTPCKRRCVANLSGDIGTATVSDTLVSANRKPKLVIEIRHQGVDGGHAGQTISRELRESIHANPSFELIETEFLVDFKNPSKCKLVDHHNSSKSIDGRKRLNDLSIEEDLDTVAFYLEAEERSFKEEQRLRQVIVEMFAATSADGSIFDTDMFPPASIYKIENDGELQNWIRSGSELLQRRQSSVSLSASDAGKGGAGAPETPCWGAVAPETPGAPVGWASSSSDISKSTAAWNIFHPLQPGQRCFLLQVVERRSGLPDNWRLQTGSSSGPLGFGLSTNTNKNSLHNSEEKGSMGMFLVECEVERVTDGSQTKLRRLQGSKTKLLAEKNGQEQDIDVADAVVDWKYWLKVVNFDGMAEWPYHNPAITKVTTMAHSTLVFPLDKKPRKWSQMQILRGVQSISVRPQKNARAQKKQSKKLKFRVWHVSHSNFSAEDKEEDKEEEKDSDEDEAEEDSDDEKGRSDHKRIRAVAPPYFGRSLGYPLLDLEGDDMLDFDDFDFDDRVCGFSSSQVDELLCQGVKPWDDDADAVMAALCDDFF